ncbi:Scr1 family TA system antitoxin-like transcriptional regulator [Nonomuraea sp. NPDC050404]|uniref:helix-turn-helix domain-containing protein n=1 Tax=Nonomuraea sp. NPDC050404 TaxID=3155783 RepID=UPI0033F1F16F
MNQPLLGRQAVQALGIRLRDLRRDAGLTGRELAAACGWVPSKVSKIELGKQVPSEDDIRDWCVACQFPSEISDLIAAVRSIDAQYTDWRRSLKTGTRRRQRANIDAYEKTQLIRAWEPTVIPGLLQTAPYARGILTTIIDFTASLTTSKRV